MLWNINIIMEVYWIIIHRIQFDYHIICFISMFYILIKKFLSILLHFKYALVYSMYARLFIARMALFWRTKILEVLFWYVPCQASIPYDKYGWISEVYNIFRIVSGRKRFSFYKSPIEFATFRDISVIWFTKFNFCQDVCPKT